MLTLGGSISTGYLVSTAWQVVADGDLSTAYATSYYQSSRMSNSFPNGFQLLIKACGNPVLSSAMVEGFRIATVRRNFPL